MLILRPTCRISVILEIERDEKHGEAGNESHGGGRTDHGKWGQVTSGWQTDREWRWGSILVLRGSMWPSWSFTLSDSTACTISVTSCLGEAEAGEWEWTLKFLPAKVFKVLFSKTCGFLPLLWITCCWDWEAMADTISGNYTHSLPYSVCVNLGWLKSLLYRQEDRGQDGSSDCVWSSEAQNEEKIHTMSTFLGAVLSRPISVLILPHPWET